MVKNTQTKNPWCGKRVKISVTYLEQEEEDEFLWTIWKLEETGHKCAERRSYFC
jgi:hypothetical protein